jgi:hypothetical protein
LSKLVRYNIVILELIVVCFVDDILITGKSNDTVRSKEEFKRFFKIVFAELGKIRKHLGVRYSRSRDSKELTSKGKLRSRHDIGVRARWKGGAELFTPGSLEIVSKKDHNL